MKIPYNGNAKNALVQRDLALDLAVQGLLAYGPTSASSATDWNVNLSPGEVIFNPAGDSEQFDAQADFDVYHGAAKIVSGQACYARIVVRDVSGTLSLVSVVGTAAATASAAIPTDAAVQAAVGAGNAWYDVALCYIALAGTTYTTKIRSTSYRTRHVLASSAG